MWFRCGCVLYARLGWQESVWSGSLSAPTPHALGCFVHSIAPLRTAPSSTVPGGSPVDVVCVAASSSLHWYRVSSFLLNPIQAFRKHDAHPGGCPATPSLTLAHSLTSLCSGSIAFTAQPSALTSFGGIGAARLGHTLAAVAVLRSLASAFTAHRHRQSTKSSLESTQGLILKIISAASVRNFKKRGRPKCVAETESAFRFIVTHWRFYRPISRVRPAYSAQMKSRFQECYAGQEGEP